MKQISLLLFFILPALVVTAQRGSVSGVAYDSIGSRRLPDVTVTVLRRSDSTLVSFNLSSSSGYFKISNLPDGDYRLLASHIGYHNSSRSFSITAAAREVDLGTLVMADKSVILSEVVVSSEAPPVTLVGDTVQYDADAFRTQPNANVEQLLKKMPGIQVERDGTIKANGETVKRILVDGKEFFGNDPKMATKNLPADAVDKVQMYDRRSDQSTLTGFDDGNSEKTINLKLKESKKKGLFGKISAGAGSDDRKEARMNVNSFRGARQLSALAMGNNTNTEGFGFSDIGSFAGDAGRTGPGGRVTQEQASAMASAASTNQGIRTIWGTGLNYNNIIGTKTDFTSNYFYNHFNPATSTNSERTYLLPDSSYNYSQRSDNRVYNNSHRLNLGIDYRIDSFHSIKINPSLGVQHSRSDVTSNYLQSGSDGRLSNSGYNNFRRESDAINFRTDLLFRKKFRRKGRTFSLSLQGIVNTSDGEGWQESVNEFHPQPGPSYRDSINQNSFDQASQKGLTGRAVYTEPVFRRSLLEFSVAKSSTSSSSAKQAYDFNKSTSRYDRLNDSLSNDFETTYGYTSAGLRIRAIRGKLNYTAGVTWQHATLEGRVIAGQKDVDLGKGFSNLLPNARAQYTFIRNKSLTLNYNSYTQQPAVSQLQPVPDISNRLNIYEGNPELKQEFIHYLTLNYMGINPFRNRSFFVFLTMARTDNKIVNSDSVFASGIKKTRPVNVDGVYNYNGDVSLGLPMRFAKGTMQLGTRASYSRGQQFVNGSANTIGAFTVGPRISLSSRPTEKIDIQAGGTFNYNRTGYSLQPAFNTSYFSQVYDADFNWELPRKIYFSTEFTYTINNRLAEGFNARVPLWNMSVSKQFMKFNRGEIKLRVNDLLNRNQGVSRTSNQSYIEDTRVNTLRRYVMLSFTYSLSKSAAGGGSGGNGFMMIRN
ncbi:MAG: hypothetical protein EOO09_03060 [Chitinophagaceae bacterium]|nr:MAG: hypothetical protein EOO09_03060 [Chitinophagaceae bacterium]